MDGRAASFSEHQVGYPAEALATYLPSDYHTSRNGSGARELSACENGQALFEGAPLSSARARGPQPLSDYFVQMKGGDGGRPRPSDQVVDLS